MEQSGSSVRFFKPHVRNAVGSHGNSRGVRGEKGDEILGLGSAETVEEDTDSHKSSSDNCSGDVRPVDGAGRGTRGIPPLYQSDPIRNPG